MRIFSSLATFSTAFGAQGHRPSSPRGPEPLGPSMGISATPSLRGCTASARLRGRPRRARRRVSSVRGSKAPSRRLRRSFRRRRRSGRSPCRCRYACSFPDPGAGRAGCGGATTFPAPPSAFRGSSAAARPVADGVSAGSPAGRSWGMGHTGKSGARKVSAKLPKKMGEREITYGIREITQQFGKSLETVRLAGY